MKPSFIISVVLSLLCNTSFAQYFKYDHEISGYSLTPALATFSNPSGIATDASGNVYVADHDNRCIQKFSNDGVFILKIGTSANPEQQIIRPVAVAVDANGNMYVCEEISHSVMKYNASGDFVKRWGSALYVSGSADGEFNTPTSITVDASGNVFVADKLNNRIQKFTSNGVFVKKWGSLGNTNGKFGSPVGVTTDAVGNVYVADAGYDMIHKFSNDGVFIERWGVSGSADGELSAPESVSVDAFGNIFVADCGNYRIQKFTSAGVYIAKYGNQGTGELEFGTHENIAADGDGNIFISDKGNNRIQKITNSGVFVRKWGTLKGIENGQLNAPSDLEIDANGNIFVISQGDSMVRKFNSDGEFVTKWKVEYDIYKNLNGGIAVDASGHVYVTIGYHIQKYTNAGQFITAWGEFGYDNGQFRSAASLAVDDLGYIYVADSYSSNIQKFSSDGAFIKKWSTNLSPYAVTVDDFRNVIVSTAGAVITKYSSSGNFLIDWVSEGPAPMYWNMIRNYYSAALVTDSEGNIYAMSDYDSFVQKFSTNGTSMWTFGMPGIGDAQFNFGRALEFDQYGNLYVADTGNNRIQVFKPSTVDPDKPSTVDPDITTAYAKPVLVPSIIVYPNPSTGTFRVSADEKDIQSVTVFNVLGQKEVFTGLEISTQLKGLLIVEILTKNNNVITKKIIIQE
mgnify:FL=1